MDPKQSIAALGVLADPNSSPEDKAAALDALSAYFNGLLDDAEAASTAAAASEAEAEGKKPEAASETAEEEEKPSKEMASAMAKIDALTKRLAGVEKASAIGNAPRLQKASVIERVVVKPAMTAQETVTIDMINRAAATNIRISTGK